MESKSAHIEALCKATLEFEPIIKDENAKVKTKSGSEYGYSYASLDMIILATRKALANNGLNITHYTEERDGKTWLITELRHSSGCLPDRTESMIDKFTADSYMSVIQNFGSIITYLKRYHIAMLLNIAIDEDDDGKAKESTKKTSSQPSQQQKEQPKSDIDTQKAKYFALADPDENIRHTWQKDNIGKESTKDWLIGDYTKAIKLIEDENIRKKQALDHIKSKFATLITLEEIDKWVSEQTNLSTSKIRKEIEALVEERKKALTPKEEPKVNRTELINKIVGLTNEKVADVNNYISDEMLASDTLVLELLAGNADAIPQFKRDLHEYLASVNDAQEATYEQQAE